MPFRGPYGRSHRRPLSADSGKRESVIHPSPSVPITVATVARLWFPLALSFELMMMEGPAIQAAIGRLPDPTLNLAAFGLTMGISLLVESPVIMLLATSTALVKDGQSYAALRRFTGYLLLLCTLVTALVAFTPLFDLVAGRLMGQPPEIVAAARPAMQIMLLWSAAIGWRRFYQGVLVGHRETRKVTWGTVVRLTVALSGVWLAANHRTIPGAQVGALALMAAVVAEALATTLFALPTIRRDILCRPREGAALSQRRILAFHFPLASTTVLMLLAQPMTAAALARLPEPRHTLAALPVVFMVLLVMRGWCFAIQEIAVSLARREEDGAESLRFAWIVGLSTSAATAAMAFTPLLDLYLGRALHAPPAVWSHTRTGIGFGILLPLLTALGAYWRGLLVAAGRTDSVYRAMLLGVGVHGFLLALAVLARTDGMAAAAGAITIGAAVEYLSLRRAHGAGASA